MRKRYWAVLIITIVVILSVLTAWVIFKDDGQKQAVTDVPSEYVPENPIVEIPTTDQITATYTDPGEQYIIYISSGTTANASGQYELAVEHFKQAATVASTDEMRDEALLSAYYSAKKGSLTTVVDELASQLGDKIKPVEGELNAEGQ